MESLTRRQLLGATAGGLSLFAGTTTASPTTVLFNDHSVELTQARVEGPDLWVRPADLPRINEFTLKPQGACRADLCVPTPKSLSKGGWFNLTGFSRRNGQSFVADGSTYSFGEIPVLRGGYLRARQSPDFAVPDRKGRTVKLSDFKGKKVLIVTWASW